MSDNTNNGDLTAALVHSVATAREVSKPFFHLEFDQVFPPETYRRMMESMPVSSDYRALPGRNNGKIRADGQSTRIKGDLFRETIRHFAREGRGVGGQVEGGRCFAEGGWAVGA